MLKRFFEGLIELRRLELLKDSGNKYFDFLTVMLKDEEYALDNELIKNDLISLFIAASSSGGAAISNFIWYMVIND